MARSTSQADTLAPLFAEGEPGQRGRPLVRLLDLVARESDRHCIPFNIAAGRVADTLEGDPSIQIFIGRAVGFSSPMPADHVWFAGVKARPAGMVIHRDAPGFVNRWGGRDLVLRAGHFAFVGERTELPALIGVAGALALFREHTRSATNAELLRRRIVGPLAILEADAARLFNSRPAQVHTLRQVLPARQAYPAIGPAGASGGPYAWATDSGLCSQLNRQFDELVNYYEADPKTARKAKGAARADLADAWGVSVSAIKQQTTGDPRQRFERDSPASLRGVTTA